MVYIYVGALIGGLPWHELREARGERGGEGRTNLINNKSGRTASKTIKHFKKNKHAQLFFIVIYLCNRQSAIRKRQHQQQHLRIYNRHSFGSVRFGSIRFAFCLEIRPMEIAKCIFVCILDMHTHLYIYIL